MKIVIKRAVVVISDKTDLKSKIIRRDKGYQILIKRSSHQEDKTIINIYAPDHRPPPNYMNNTDTIEGKREIYTKEI